MPLTEHDVIKIIEKHDGGDHEESHGPFQLDQLTIWEIWVWVERPKKGYNTRFIIDETGQYFDSFATLCRHLGTLQAEQLQSLKSRIVNLESSQAELLLSSKEKSFRLYVSAFVFVAAISVMLIILLMNQNNPQTTILTCITSVVASGSAFFFGTSKKSKSQP